MRTNAELSIDDTPGDFRLKVMEALGWLVYCVHRNRGRLNWLIFSRAALFTTRHAGLNWDKMDAEAANWEKWIWSLVPPRALLGELRDRRHTGELAPDLALLLVRDIFGRKPTSSTDPLHRSGDPLPDELDANALLKALGIEDENEFRLRVMEVIGWLTLCVHQNRKRMCWLTDTGAINLDKSHAVNWEVLDKGVADTEEILFQLVPPRALLNAMRGWRQRKRIPDDFKGLLRDVGRWRND